MFWVSLCEYLYIICQFNEYFWFVFAELGIKPSVHALPLSPTPVLIQIHFYFFTQGILILNYSTYSSL